MKAIVFTKYGSPDVLKLEDIEKPTPKDNEILVKVHAASVNDWDWGLLRGKPFMIRLFNGLIKPKTRIMGTDVAGKVEAVGSKVQNFKPGDEVYGDISACGFGSFAEYVCASEKALKLKPNSLTFVEAASIPHSGVLALQGILDIRQLQPGQKILINGAGGGAGTLAIQLAKLKGVEITGVDKTEKLDKMRSLGADYVIDYTVEDFTKNGQCYDLIIDFQGHHSIFDNMRSLSPKGFYTMVGGATSRMFQVLLLGPLLSMTSSKKLGILYHSPNKHLDYMEELLEADKVTTVIDKCYPLIEVPEAIRYFGAGNAIGKLLITIVN